MSRTIASCVLLVALAGGCATAAPANGEATAQTQRRTNPNLLTQEELREVQASTMYDAIERLRPRWLTVRSQRSFTMDTQIVVFQNQTLLGGVEVLRQLSPDAATSIQYLDGSTAAASLPGLTGRHIEGAIVIRTAAR